MCDTIFTFGLKQAWLFHACYYQQLLTQTSQSYFIVVPHSSFSLDNNSLNVPLPVSVVFQASTSIASDVMLLKHSCCPITAMLTSFPWFLITLKKSEYMFHFILPSSFYHLHWNSTGRGDLIFNLLFLFSLWSCHVLLEEGSIKLLLFEVSKLGVVS